MLNLSNSLSIMTAFCLRLGYRPDCFADLLNTLYHFHSKSDTKMVLAEHTMFYQRKYNEESLLIGGFLLSLV